ncbi:GNAT family N-acetyltransferase [Gordonia liuliyuniae]|uniref:GNAT family N-acetyltransferase n=1 Tax=Gordonia liuliyuniae TaxID=2911517 RepID=A0ABS9ITU3_9ACTN|nr:GNAT family N-acetyltransferase [Gordonia liuliyuniae]MCF8588979.1 GNAT family N-acetyltransferase [Gordonia liuliyuniae]
MPGDLPSVRPGRFRRRSARVGIRANGERTLILTVSLLATAVTVFWGFRAKFVCGGAPFDDAGRSEIFPSGPRGTLIPCYSDLMQLWTTRGLGEHLMPYVHGGIDAQGQLFGGVVEYPVLSGLLIWFGAAGSETDVEFFTHSALILAPFAFATTILLALMTRWWVLLWAATPPLVLYAFHNWELPVVFTSVAAIAIMAYGASANPETGGRRLPVRHTAIAATVMLGIGFSLKIYPGLFVLPVALYVLTSGGVTGAGGSTAAARRVRDWAGAGWVAVTAVVTVAAAQLPFVIAGFDGWKAALDFQGQRRADVTTNSIWYWGLRFLTGGETSVYRSFVDIMSPLAIVVGVAVVTVVGWRILQRDGVYPWLPVAASILAVFMLFHKVHSPQYTLWILPFFVLLRVRAPLIVTYLVADIVLDLSVFRMLGMSNDDGQYAQVVTGIVAASTWVQAIVLAVLIVSFVSARPRQPLASYLSGATPRPGPLTRLSAADAAEARAWVGEPTYSRGSVVLRPIVASDAPALAGLVDDSDLPLYQWTGPIPRTTQAAAAWIAEAATSTTRVAFAVVHDGRLVGTTSFYDVDAANRSLSIGYTFYSADAMGTAVNPTAKLLLLDHAFDVCGAVRVVWHTHESNERSRAAISKLGAEFEGLLPKHRRFARGERSEGESTPGERSEGESTPGERSEGESTPGERSEGESTPGERSEGESTTAWRTTAQFAMTDDAWPTRREVLVARATPPESAADAERERV